VYLADTAGNLGQASGLIDDYLGFTSGRVFKEVTILLSLDENNLVPIR
jgi:hypothetical protein